MAKRSYTITEAAKKLKVSRQAVHLAIKKELLHATEGPIKVKIVQVRTVTTKGWRISASALEDYHRRLSPSHQERGKKS